MGDIFKTDDELSDNVKITSMELHEEIEIDERLTVLKVPGGWIYRTITPVIYYREGQVAQDTVVNSVFVPDLNKR